MELFITMMVVLTVFAAAADEYNAVNVKENEGHVYVFKKIKLMKVKKKLKKI